MGRKIIKLLPDKMTYAEKIEFWLNNMAKEGLILKYIHQNNLLSHYFTSQEVIISIGPCAYLLRRKAYL